MEVDTVDESKLLDEYSVGPTLVFMYTLIHENSEKTSKPAIQGF